MLVPPETPAQSFQDYVALLRNNPRYATALNTGADVQAFASGLQRGGYATGAILTVKALYELARTQKRYALVTMCIGGGQGIAAIFERA